MVNKTKTTELCFSFLCGQEMHVSKALVFLNLIVPCVSLYRRVHCSRAVPFCISKCWVRRQSVQLFPHTYTVACTSAVLPTLMLLHSENPVTDGI